MEEIISDVLKTLAYWVAGVIFIGVNMLAVWAFDNTLGSGDKTFLDLLVVAGVFYIPFIVGRVMMMRND